MYRCHVSNSEGNLTHITHLQVKGPPVIVIPPEDTTMNMSESAALQCHADAYPSNLTYEWQKEGQNVYNIESLRSRVKILVDGTLLISKLIPEDSGNYTCISSNGLLTPPSASAYLKVKYPARVVMMPKETYLPAGMSGTIVCPFQAEPPMLFVNWTKDGVSLDLHQYPGWTINSEGSVFITTTNNDAVGMYTCTAYNSYGTMGQSEPTKVILKDPPSFQVSPRAKYLQEIGRELTIPCQGRGDPAPNITWTKVGSTPCSPFTVLSNGSLLLHPLSKNHQGKWECHATNSVATVSKGTVVLVLGTSPHAVTAVSIAPGINNANVSWEPGFDGGYTQKFSIWVKPAKRGKHEWTSVPVPTSKSSLLVTGLQPSTSYQFSILPQNKLGSGPFSEIVTIMTLAPPKEPPTVVTDLAALLAPTSLSINYTAVGVLLRWLPPPAHSPLITAYMLQARQEKGKWVTLDGEIPANTTEILVQGLTRDSCYELRLLSHGAKIVSDPSESVNITTEGMDLYPAPSSLLTQPLMAGVIAGMCFLFVAIILSMVTACIVNHRRKQGCMKRQNGLTGLVTSTGLRKTRSPHLPVDSPSSILKMKLCPPLNFFPNSSSSDHSGHSSIDKGSRSEFHDQKKQLLPSSSPPPCYTLFESHLGSSPSSLSAIQSISRGPDGRFIAQPYLEDSMAMHSETKKEFPQSPVQENSEGRKRSSFQNSPTTCSVSSEKRVIPDLPSTGQGSQSQGLTQLKEQEESLSHRAQCEEEQKQTKSASPIQRWSEAELDDTILKPQNILLRQKAKRPSSLTQQVSEYRRGCYFGNTSSPMERLLTSTSPNIQWDISPVTSHVRHSPVQSLLEGKTPHSMLRETPPKCLEHVEDTAAEDHSHSPITQYTSISILSPQRDSHSFCKSDISKALARCPERPVEKDLSSRISTEDQRIQEREIKTQASVSMSTCPVPCGEEASPIGHYQKLSNNLSHSFTGCYTITSDKLKSDHQIQTQARSSSASLQAEDEKENVRARSRKSDKCIFNVSTNPISPLPLFENEVQSDQSNCSFRFSHIPQPDRMSPLQPSTILEYLSLPGFVEMSVDEPIEECEIPETTSLSTNQADGTLVRGEPDVVPKNWGSHYHLEGCDGHQSRFLMDVKKPIISVGHSISENVTSSELAQGNTSKNPGSSETKKSFSTQYLAYGKKSPQQLFSHKNLASVKPTNMSIAQPLERPKVVYNIPNQGEAMKKSLPEHIQWCQPQNKRTNQISARISQAPVPLMKKSVSIGPCRTLSGMGQPCSYLRKSTSLGSQQWDHHQGSRTYVSHNYNKVELPNLSVKEKSYNLGCTPANTYLSPETSCKGTRCARSYSSYGPKRPYFNERAYMTSSSLMHVHVPSVLEPPKHVRLCRQELDPRRQATTFPESLRCPLSYQETLRLVQHRYVPNVPPRPISAPRQVARLDHPHPVDSRNSFQRPLLPRGYSWPSAHQAAFPSAEIQRELYEVVGMNEARESTIKGCRASYDSQSSGRGSVGPFGHLQQSAKEVERHKRETDLPERRLKSMNTPVDESYEFDATECQQGLDLLEAMKIKQAGMGQGRDLRCNRPLSSTGLQDLQDKDPNSFVSFPFASQPPQQPHIHSLSETRFNALMQEFQEYRKALDSQNPCPLPDLNYDLESALL
ncbi:uncharacterized protein igsf9b [Clarias gariepinus]